MKRFEFTFEKAHRYRQAQLRAEEARLGMLLASEASLEHRRQELRSQHLLQRQELAHGSEFDGAQLERLHQFGEFVAIEVHRLSKECEALRREIELQLKKVAACKQKVELLEKLKAKQLGNWTRDAAKELQLAAEESFNARWLKGMRETR